MFKDYYAILDVAPSASGEEIRRAFKRLALQFHPDKVGVGGTADATSTMRSDERSITAKWTDGEISNDSFSALNPPTTSSHVFARNFIDIQEAYEVLGDVARRYLYDMNYQELLVLQEQRQQEERRRCEAHARAIAEAARQARERALLREQYQRSLQAHPTKTASMINSVNADDSAFPKAASFPSCPQKTACPSQGQRATGFKVAVPSSSPADTPQEDPPRHKNEPIEEAKEGDCLLEDISSDEGGVPQAPKNRNRIPTPTDLLNASSHSEGCRTKGKNLHVGSEYVAPVELQRQVSSSRSRRKKQHSAATLPAAFVLSSSLSFNWSETPAQTRQSDAESNRSRRQMWRRHITPRYGEADDEPELPLEYYYKRSVERTLRVFFGAPNSE